jgi:putative membrane protein
MGLLRTILALFALLIPATGLAHPSGLPQLRERAVTIWGGIDAALVWDFHESIVIGVLALALLYGLAITRWRTRLGGPDATVESWRVWLYYGNCLLLYLTLDGVLHHLADELFFSAHMLQHMVLQLLWAPFLVLAVPPWLWRALAKPMPRLARFLTRPMVAFLAFNGVMWGWHWPACYETALRIHAWHIVQHLTFMSSAVMLWFVLIAPLDELRASYARRMVFILSNMLAMKALGLTLALSEHVLYPFYQERVRILGFDPLSDQQLGAMLMWMPGGGFLWFGMARIWWQWVRTGTPDKGLTGIPALDAARARRRGETPARTATAGTTTAGISELA